MEEVQKSRDSLTTVWDEEHVKALLNFPRFPIHLIQPNPWQSWISQRGGLKVVYAYLQAYPLSPSHRRILDVVLSNPEAVSDVYASRLNISRATYFYQLRELVPVLVQALNHWELEPAPSQTVLPEITPSFQPTLPVPLTSLIGAEEVLQSLNQLLLREDVRLISLLGPGGIGKTRLAIDLARQVSGSFANNITFVDLSNQPDPSQVGKLIAQTLGLKDVDENNLKSYLRPRSFLLILDNFEHLMPAKTLVVDLLATAPRLKMVVTSRAALHIYGEHEFAVPPLSAPSPEKTWETQLAIISPAIRLFVQRAQSVNPAFSLTIDNVGAVIELCTAMEGNPLAIELTAFQIKYFSPQAMLVRLANSRRLVFLSHVPKRLPLHQQTLRDMLEWSYVLLSPQLRTLFNRLAVFPGGCTFEAAEAVCSDLPADGLAQDKPCCLVNGQPFTIQEGITSLADQSLLTQSIEADGEPRFCMPGITREYACEHLEQDSSGAAYRRSHALYYLQLVEKMEKTGDSQYRQAAFTVIKREYANLKAALLWTLDRREGEMGLRFTAALWDFWLYDSRHQDERLLAQTILEQTADLQLPIRARVMRLYGWLAQDYRDYTTMLWAFQNCYDLSETIGDRFGMGLAWLGLGELSRLRGQDIQARDYLQRGQSVFTELHDSQQCAWSLDLMGRLELGAGNLAQAQDLFQQSLSMFRKNESHSGTLNALCHLGQAWFYQGETGQARQLFEEGLEICRNSGNPHSSIMAVLLNYLGEIAIHQSQPRLAREYVDQCLHLSKVMGYSWCTDLGCFASGLLALREGELESAAFYLRESLLLQQSLKENWRVLALLETVAYLSIQRHDPLGAARLYGVVERLHSDFNIQQLPIYREQAETGLKQIKQQLNPAALEETWSAGQALSLDEALAYALRCLE